jgi:hypothetical protein
MVVLLAAGGLGLAVAPAQAVSAGTAVGWGDNYYGESSAPAGLAGKNVTAIAAGYFHSLALTSDGQVTTWGGDDQGESNVPASLSSQTVTAVAAGGYHSLALTSDGQVTAWGSNDQGESNVPASLSSQTVTAISAGYDYSLALTSDGQVTAWGQNMYGQSSVPASLSGQTVTAISAGFGHILALTSDGQVTSWGRNDYGQRNLPANLSDQTVTAISGGDLHSLALTSDGQVTAWGYNGNGETNVPAGLASQTVTAIAAGGYHSMALTSDGQVTAWGMDIHGQTTVPTAPDGAPYTAIAGGVYHSLGIVASEEFTTSTSATITGTPQVGQVLTADAGDVAPAPDSYSYRWFADGTLISGASSAAFTPTATEQGAAITVEIRAVKTGYTSSTDTSEATDPVAAGTIAVTGTPTITGTPTVGQTLTGDSSTVNTDPDATLAEQWLRDGSPIPDADSSSYTLTNSDAGANITFQVTATKAGFTDASVTSDAVGPVDGGLITLPTPTITGTAAVDGTLSAVLPDGLDPADAVVSFEWFRGTTSVGTGSTYSPVAADVGAVLTTTATATKDYFDPVSQSAETAEVAEATFGTAPVATISGTLKVGEVLTADAGTVAPDPDSYSYQWYADDSPITDATEATFTLTSSQRHATITVEVTATKDGYEDAVDLSDPSADVATDLAPDLQLDSADPTLRRGQSTTLTWTSEEAETVTASGAWVGSKDPSGSTSVSPSALGASTYVLEASNANGTTTTQANILVTRQATALVVTAQRGLHLARTPITVTARGLDAGESYILRIGGIQVAAGSATSTGTLTRRVILPSRARDGLAAVTVIGSESDRTGRTMTLVLTNKTLGLRLKHRRVQVRHRQWVTITGLASRERILVGFKGRRVSPRYARADTNGVYRLAFRVGVRRGIKTVKARGQFAGRTAAKSFRVTRH